MDKSGWDERRECTHSAAREEVALFRTLASTLGFPGAPVLRAGFQMLVSGHARPWM